MTELNKHKNYLTILSSAICCQKKLMLPFCWDVLQCISYVGLDVLLSLVPLPSVFAKLAPTTTTRTTFTQMF